MTVLHPQAIHLYRQVLGTHAGNTYLMCGHKVPNYEPAQGIEPAYPTTRMCPKCSTLTPPKPSTLGLSCDPQVLYWWISAHRDVRGLYIHTLFKALAQHKGWQNLIEGDPSTIAGITTHKETAQVWDSLGLENQSFLLDTFYLQSLLFNGLDPHEGLHTRETPPQALSTRTHRKWDRWDNHVYDNAHMYNTITNRLQQKLKHQMVMQEQPPQ